VKGGIFSYAVIRHRCALPGAGERARPPAARTISTDTELMSTDDLRADLAARLHQWHRRARGESGSPEFAVSLHSPYEDITLKARAYRERQRTLITNEESWAIHHPKSRLLPRVTVSAVVTIFFSSG